MAYMTPDFKLLSPLGIVFIEKKKCILEDTEKCLPLKLWAVRSWMERHLHSIYKLPFVTMMKTYGRGKYLDLLS